MAEQKDSAATTSETTDKAVGDTFAGRDGKRVRAGVAVGIGSAAIVAALMYARSGRARKK